MAEDRTLLFRVEDRGAGVRLDLLIPKLLPEVSRSRAQKLIVTGLVTVNDRPAQKRYLARATDTLRITLPRPEPPACHAEDLPLRVLHEDDDFLVIDKAPGMVVHPAPGHARGTLVNALLHRTPALSRAGGGFRPGLVHRLDKDTSGLVLVARNDHSHRHLFVIELVDNGKAVVEAPSGMDGDGVLPGPGGESSHGTTRPRAKELVTTSQHQLTKAESPHQPMIAVFHIEIVTAVAGVASEAPTYLSYAELLRKYDETRIHQGAGRALRIAQEKTERPRCLLRRQS